MKRFITVLCVLALTFGFAQVETSRPAEATDWFRVLDTDARSWDYTLHQFLNDALNSEFNSNGFGDTYSAGGFSLKIADTFTQNAGVAHKSILSDLTYAPTTGTACPIAIVGKVTLDGDLTDAGSQQYPGMGWGVQGQMHVATGTTIDGGNYVSEPGAIYAGLRGVITGAGSTTYTKGFLTAVYAEIQLAQANANDGANFNIYGLWVRNQGIASTTDIAAGIYMNTHSLFPNTILKGIDIDANTAVVGIEIDAVTTGIDFQGAYSNAAVDFSDVTLTHNGSAGPVFIRAGNYTTPVANASNAQSGMIRFYGQTSGTSSYDRGIFTCLKTTGAKGIISVAGLVEVLAQGAAGPVNVKGGEFVAGLHTSDAKLATAGKLIGGMFRIYSEVGSVAASGSIVAPLWLSNQMSGTVSGEEYAIYADTGAAIPEAFIGLTTTGEGYDAFLSFDDTYGAQNMLKSGDIDDGTNDYYLIIKIDGSPYGFPLYSL